MITPTDPPQFQHSFKSSDLGTRAALKKMREFLFQQSLSEDACGTVELVMAEVLNNVVEHAYPASGTEGEVRLLTWCDGASLRFEVRDTGAAMPNGKVPLGNPPEVKVAKQDLPEGGFGWFLIHKLVREISYERRNDENCLMLDFDVKNLT